MALVNRLLPETSENRMLEALLLGQEYLHSFGITGWQDAIVGSSYGDAGDPAPRTRAHRVRALLTARVVGALWWDRGRGLEQIDELVEKRAALTVDRLPPTSVKVMQDGVAENFTAAMLAPYGDGHGASDRQLGDLVRRPGDPERGGRPARCARVPAARARDRRSRGPGALDALEFALVP